MQILPGLPAAADPAPGRSESAADPPCSVPRNRSLSVIGHGALLVTASGIPGSHLHRTPSEDRRKIEQPESEMLTEPCRSVFMQFGRWIVK